MKYKWTGDDIPEYFVVQGFYQRRLGLYDMSGNAWEWTSDDYTLYSPASQTNPYGVSQDDHPQKVLRGGRWGGDASEARVFSRAPFLPNDRCNNSGFRITRTAGPQVQDGDRLAEQAIGTLGHQSR
jgi:formylglycine-generating enzyme required for sulfatase activity